VSCSDFQKALKSEDTAEKFKVGTEYFEAEKWSKAYRIFDQILPTYRGKPQAEKLTYMHAMCSYKQGDYYIASYHFDKFTDIYVNSEKAEEAAFLGAKGYYFNSPVYSKEQKETVEAIEKLQLFINAYPNSEYLTEANLLVKELDYKLENKAFNIAKQYDLIKDYKASIKSFNNFLLEFPGTTLRNEALFFRFDAAYNLAILSVDYLKEERVKEALAFYASLKKAFPNSEYLEQATLMQQELQNELNTFNLKS
jgi:outer membrane protein assembly factor BamD